MEKPYVYVVSSTPQDKTVTELLSWGLIPLEQLEKCNYVYVIPDSGNSVEVQAEVRRAGELDIPVFYSLEDLLTEADILHKTW